MMATQSKEVNLMRNQNQQARENRPKQQGRQVRLINVNFVNIATV